MRVIVLNINKSIQFSEISPQADNGILNIQWKIKIHSTLLDYINVTNDT